jgi:hypothetical protein
MQLNEPDMITDAIKDTLPELGVDGILKYLAGECELRSVQAQSESERSYWNTCAEMIENTMENLPEYKR